MSQLRDDGILAAHGEGADAIADHSSGSCSASGKMRTEFMYLPILDGWRAFSILAVLAGHWLPLGPAEWQLNAAVATTGMAIFFVLSGFLITQFLFFRPQVKTFLIRRIARIVPLSWAAMLILALANQESTTVIAANLAFFANLAPAKLMAGGEHLWSLCVEIQFYACAAVLALTFERRGLYALPVLAIIVTLLRIEAGEVISIVTWHRVDEILAGATAALIYNHGKLDAAVKLPRGTVALLAALLVFSSSPLAGAFGYVRPYLAGAMIAVSIFSAPVTMKRIWCSSAARYLASISYAVYVFHGILTATPLGGAAGWPHGALFSTFTASVFNLASGSSINSILRRFFCEIGQAVNPLIMTVANC